MWIRNLSGAAATVVAAIAIAGCGASAGGSTSSTAGSGGLDGKKVTLVTCTNSNAWCSRWSADTTKALEAKGVKVTVLTHNFDASQEVQMLNQAISSRPDLILLHETADTKAVIPAIKKAKQQGVPVINIDGRAEDEVVPELASQVIHDNVELGRIAARNIVQGLKDSGRESGGNVAAITGTASMLITQDRMKGFGEEMAKYPQYKVVATEDGNWDPVKSGQLAQQLLAKFRDDLDAVYGMADYQAVPIVQAAKQAGIKVGAKDAGLIITGSNCTAAGNAAVLAADLYGSATEDPPTAAKYSAEAAEKFLSGEKLPPIIQIPVEQVTTSNAGEFTTRCTY